MAELALRFLGFPQIAANGIPVALTRRKGIGLLAYLALTARPQSRDTLATLLWPGYDQASARTNLRRTLYVARAAIGEQFLRVSKHDIALVSGHQVWSDVHDFSNILCRNDPRELDVETLTRTVMLYHGDFLQGLVVDDSPEFDAWQRQEADILRRGLAAGSEALITKLAARRDYAEAVRGAQHSLTHLPAQESIHRALMELYACSGRRAEALRQYATCCERLRAELDVAPSPATQALYERIRRGQFSPQPEINLHNELPAVRSIATMVAQSTHPRVMLPRLPTPFVARTAELAAIKTRLLDPNCRLLVLLGPGGIGKTYLAAQAAADCAAAVPTFPAGVVWVDLAGRDTPDAAAPAIADALGLVFHRDEPETAQLVNYLDDKSLLLVLDNFEHIIEAADLVAALMDGAVKCTLLVTSRVALNLRAEWIYAVGGMSYPGAEAGPDQALPDVLPDYDAVRLFHAAGRRQRNRFSLPAHAVTIVRICQLVDGMPLALELAASWLRSMSCEEIATRLAADTRLLSTRQRGVPARHTSIQAIFDYSWALLSAVQQRVLARLSVLHGHFTLAAAEAVASATYAQIAELIEHSFVRRTEPEDGYSLHELLRQFAANKLAEDRPLMRATQQAHAEYYAHFLAARGGALVGPEQAAVLSEINVHKDSIRAAWRWAASNQARSILTSMLPPLFDFYLVRSLFQTGVGAAEEALAALPASGVDGWLAAQLHNRAAICRFYLGEHEKSQQFAASAYQQALRAGAATEEAYALRVLGMNATVLDGFSPADDHFVRALGIYTRIGDEAGAAITHYELGANSLMADDPASARHHFQRSLKLSRRMQQSRWMAYALDLLAFINFNSGDFARSAREFDEAMQLFQTLGDRRGVGKTIGGAERARLYAGTESVRAVVDAGETALKLFVAIGDKREEMRRLRILCHVMLHDARDVAAARRYIDRALPISAQWPTSLEHARTLQFAGVVALFEDDLVRAREELLAGHALYWAHANPLGLSYVALLLAKGVDINPQHGRTAIECQMDAVSWLIAIRLHSPTYFWIRVRDWVDEFLDRLRFDLFAPRFAQAEVAGRALEIEEIARMVVERSTTPAFRD